MADDIAHLLNRIAQQDKNALRTLYQQTAPKLMGIFMRMLGNRPDAEDALQDVMIKIWNRASAFDPEKGTGMGWIGAIARNHALDRLRSARPARLRMQPAGHGGDEHDDPIARLPDPSPDAATRTLARAEMMRVVTCIKELPADRASAVQGAYLQGLSYQELASRFDVPLNTMRTWLRRALISLKECLDK
ncbi:sigma-70 family RNA polymerase sigma factor [Roseinatronobacter alkalisoli]|uniref:Sigma-70 family RNA polymerase sigma factor n=1 Tax=Roseinatronobacter alkalisoli TaxID=3028235 RepID=A0ABT5T6F6_9RHOB|nr:sigma-70 family RNA polymerase sigma factor [Roseinatronobacter sp. HJB301]MDD7970691.1 sigma-70 family RNA polymerase sigma factor [Roseinatronobacter sp. HJB301]